MIDKTSVEFLIGRELTEKEIRVVKWLNGWEKDTSGAIAHLINAAYLNGRLEKQESED